MKTGAVIVLYNPDLGVLSQSLDILCPQIDLICLVDNSSDSCEEALPLKPNVHYIPLYQNTGIAAAQNRGIDYLRLQGCHYLIFCDQDSTSPIGLIAHLKGAFESLLQAGLPVAVLGPEPINPKTGRSYYNKPDNNIRDIQLTVGTDEHQFTEVFSTLSSYSLTTIPILEEVGGLDESLFIDGVDNEWGWRARHFKGLKSYVDHSLKFEHHMGQSVNLPINIKKSAPMRLYYQYRNFFILSRRSYTPSFWIRHCAYTYILKLFFYPLFMSPRIQNARNILKGIRDGIRYKSSNP